MPSNLAITHTLCSYVCFPISPFRSEGTDLVKNEVFMPSSKHVTLGNAHAPFLNKLLYSVEETTQLLGVCRTTVYALSNKGLLPKTKIGRKTLFRASVILDLLDSLSTEEN